MNFQPVINSLINTLTGIINFIPRLVNGLIILLLGYIISALVRWILRLIFRSIRLDQLAERAGINNAMSSLGVRASLSDMLAQIAFFFLLLSFATSAISLVGLTALADLLQSVLHFIPRAISAAVLVVFGSMLARFLGNAIIAVADNVNITYGKALGKIIEYAIVAFVVVLAISTLGVDTTILTTSFTIIIAAAGLAIALTFASGSRESARNVIAGFYVRQNFRPGQRLTLGEYSGKVRSTVGAYTVLDTVNESGENTTISLPNFMLLQTAVAGQEDTSNASTQPAVSDQENTTTEGNDQSEAPGT
ncbi:MAG: mechanosensitive ion channel family protein [Ktedonobacteraceae bacterium]